MGVGISKWFLCITLEVWRWGRWWRWSFQVQQNCPGFKFCSTWDWLLVYPETGCQKERSWTPRLRGVDINDRFHLTCNLRLVSMAAASGLAYWATWAIWMGWTQSACTSFRERRITGHLLMLFFCELTWFHFAKVSRWVMFRRIRSGTSKERKPWKLGAW